MGVKANKNRLIIPLAVVLVAAIAVAGLLASPYLFSSNSPFSSPTPTPPATSNPTASSTPANTSPAATPTSTSTTYPVTFTASGLDNSANSTVVTTSMGDVTFAQLPFTVNVPSGTTVTYSFQANVTTTAEGCLYQLSNAPSTNSVTVTSSTTVNAVYGRAIIDAKGTLIKIPAASQINRVADLWGDHAIVDILCGVGDKLVATFYANQQNPMFKKLLPQTPAINTTSNVEELLKLDPDIVIWTNINDAASMTAMENAGLLVVRLYYSHNLDEMFYNIRMTGWIFGPDAYAKANAYLDYFNGIYSMVSSRTSQIADADKPTVLSFVRANNLNGIYTGGEIVSTWTNICGAKMFASDYTTSITQTVNLEQILAWNPDIIIIGRNALSSPPGSQGVTEIMSNPDWSTITAVKTSSVYNTPMGIYDWTVSTMELPLTLLWGAQHFHPDLFTDVNIRTEMTHFFQTFFGYTLSDAEINAILNGTPDAI
jgi:iron complex transport system substrate-binding protein